MDARRTQREEGPRCRNGIKVTLDDTDGREQLVLETPGGQKVTLQDGPGRILARGLERKLRRARAERDHGHCVGEGHGERKHGRDLGQHARPSTPACQTFSGVVKADTVITNSVVASSRHTGYGKHPVSDQEARCSCFRRRARSGPHCTAANASTTLVVELGTGAAEELPETRPRASAPSRMAGARSWRRRRRRRR